MCQNQSFLTKISQQRQYVLELIKDIKSDLNHSWKIKRYNNHILTAFQVMESLLGKISIFDEDDNNSQQEDSSFCQNFNKRTYSQIIGITESDTQNIDQSQDQSIDESSSQIEQIKPEYDCNNRRGPYRSYQPHQKLYVVKLHEEGNTYAFISKLLGIPQKNIVRWCKNGIYRKQGAGRKIGDAEMQNNVLRWINRSFNQGDSIKGKLIRQKAMEYSTKNGFKSSKGWLKNFLRRHHVGQRYLIS